MGGSVSGRDEVSGEFNEPNQLLRSLDFLFSGFCANRPPKQQQPARDWPAVEMMIE